MTTRLRKLRAITDLPYVTPQGRVVVQEGYDPDSGIYLHLPPPPDDWQPRVSLRPGRDDVRSALATMMMPWSAYRFAGGDDAAGMVSAVLAAVSRGVLDMCPAFLFDASQQGSGKTKAALALGAVVVGERQAVTPFSGSGPGADDELRKRLVASAVEGRRFAVIDNVVGHLKSPALAATLTSGRLEDRVLGQSRTVRAEVVSLLTLTANNASLDADLSRRIVQIRIDAGPNPTHRAFHFDPVSVALAQRRQVAESACTVLAAWFAAGAPSVVPGDAGGYADWNRLCRQPVLWLAQEGYADALPWGPLGDPAASLLADPSASDPEIEATGALLHSLWVVSGGDEFVAADAAEWAAVGSQSGDRDDAIFKVSEAVRDCCGRTEVSAVTMGRVLMNRRDRCIGGLKLIDRVRGSSKVWRVVLVESIPV